MDHELASKEYNGAAAVEGWADFYAASVFNNAAASDCSIGYPADLDWDVDNVVTADPVTNIDRGRIDCETGPNGSTSPVDAHDYFGDFCAGYGYTDNRATEFDYLRFLWDLHTDESMSVDDILAIYIESDPDNWNATGEGTGSGYPAYELRQAASRLSFLTEWDNQDNANGVQR